MKGWTVGDPKALRVIDDPDVVRLISDPLRLRILEILRQHAHTVKELADLLDLPRTRLYYHVKLLEEHDLINVVGTREVSGIIERQYRATAFRLSVAKSFFGASAEAGSPVDTFISLIFEEVSAEIRRAVAAGLIDLEQTHEDTILPRRLVIGRTWFRFTDEEVAEFRDLNARIRQRFAANTVLDTDIAIDGAEGDLYEFLTGFYPVVSPDQDGHDG